MTPDAVGHAVALYGDAITILQRAKLPRAMKRKLAASLRTFVLQGITNGMLRDALGGLGDAVESILPHVAGAVADALNGAPAVRLVRGGLHLLAGGSDDTDPLEAAMSGGGDDGEEGSGE